MAFQLKPDQPIRKNLQRLARKQLDEVLDQLADPRSRSDAVHEARKSFKRLRAVLRLARLQIAAHVYKAENLALRDASRPLTQARDAKVLVETLDELAAHH